MTESQTPGSEPRYVSTAQVAKALGVSVTTVKRWVDEGVLPAHRTAGGHRKLLMADVLRITREEGLPQADLSKLIPKPQAVDLTNPEAIRDQLIDAIKIPDNEMTRSLIHGAYYHGYSIETLADQVIAPAMRHIGLMWQENKIQILHEHRATQAVVSALYELKAYLRTQIIKGRPVAVGGAPETDHSILPSLLAKLVLLDIGWDAINLGPHTPMGAFSAALDDEQLKPQLVWLCVSHIAFDEELFLQQYVDFYRRAEARGIAVAIGGGGITEALRRRMPYTTYGDGLSQLSAFARTLHRLPTKPRRGRPPGRGNGGPVDHDENDTLIDAHLSDTDSDTSLES